MYERGYSTPLESEKLGCNEIGPAKLCIYIYLYRENNFSMYVYKVWANTTSTNEHWKFIKRESEVTETEEHEIRENFCQELIARLDCTIINDGLTLYTIE